MPDFCEECFCAKDAVCPKCHEEMICGDCEQTCSACYFREQSDYDAYD